MSLLAAKMRNYHGYCMLTRSLCVAHFHSQVWQEDAMFWQRQMKEYDSMSSNRRRLEAESSMLSMS